MKSWQPWCEGGHSEAALREEAAPNPGYST